MKSLAELRILIVGQLDYGSTSWSREKAFRQLVREVDTFPIMPWIHGLPLWKHILTNHLWRGPNIAYINRIALHRAQEFRPDLVWIEKGVHLSPETIKRLRKSSGLLVHFSADNQMISGNQSPFYMASIPLYDVHVTTKPHNVEWLRAQDAQRVEQMGKGFDPDLHRPITLTPEEQTAYACDVGFVGHWEPSRETLLLWLWQQGYRVKARGGRNWHYAKHRRHPLFAECHQLMGDDYAKALCGAKINLCLLSQWFGDKSTARSIEIPACGRFMLAERTDEHLSLFQEGLEAEFYSTREEMVEKINFYLAHDAARETIARAGRARCLADYSNKMRLRDLLTRVLGG